MNRKSFRTLDDPDGHRHDRISGIDCLRPHRCPDSDPSRNEGCARRGTDDRACGRPEWQSGHRVAGGRPALVTGRGRLQGGADGGWQMMQRFCSARVIRPRRRRMWNR